MLPTIQLTLLTSLFWPQCRILITAYFGKYIFGGLLHDFGKTKIDPRVLKHQPLKDIKRRFVASDMVKRHFLT